MTDKFRIVDEFRYDNWRIPGQWATAETALFGTLPPVAGEAGMQLPVGVFSATNCPAAASFPVPIAPFTAPDLRLTSPTKSQVSFWPRISGAIRLSSSTNSRVALRPTSAICSQLVQSRT